MKLYLDDERPTPIGWFGVKNFKEFVDFIENNCLPDEISFDHDLADEHYNDLFSHPDWNVPGSGIKLKYKEYKEKTGYECIKWLVEYCIKNEIKLPKCYCHTKNIVGRENILSYIKFAKERFNL